MSQKLYNLKPIFVTTISLATSVNTITPNSIFIVYNFINVNTVSPINCFATTVVSIEFLLASQITLMQQITWFAS